MNKSDQTKLKNVIVGAGLSGLLLARNLCHEPTLVLEKSNGVGGRMATRRNGDFAFDHGVQFYEKISLVRRKNFGVVKI